MSDTEDNELSLPHLELTIISGKDLAPKDSNGKSDPYVMIWPPVLHEDIGGKYHKAFKTSIIEKTLNPEWNQTFQFLNGITFEELEQHREKFSDFKIQLWDWDAVGEHDFMGWFGLSLLRFIEEKDGFEETFQLLPSEKHQDKVQGELTIRARYVSA